MWYKMMPNQQPDYILVSKTPHTLFRPSSGRRTFARAGKGLLRYQDYICSKGDSRGGEQVQLHPGKPAPQQAGRVSGPTQAWTAEKQVVKPVKKKKEGIKKPRPKQYNPQYQRNKRSDKRDRYRWEKVESDSESSDGGGQSDGTLPEEGPLEEGVVHKGRLLRERKRHKWGDYQAVLTARALYLYSREFDYKPKEVLPLWGTKLSINADKTDLQYSFILKTPSTNKNKALLKMSCLTETEMRTWLTKIREAMKLNMEMTSELARNKKTSVFGELPEHPSWSHEGYRIDVSYISDNLIVCSFPPTRSVCKSGTDQISKQPIRTRYLGHVVGYQPIRDQYFLIRSGSYKIVNVCEKSYDSTMFGDNITSYPTPSNSVARLSHLWNFCEFVVGNTCPNMGIMPIYDHNAAPYMVTHLQDQWLKEDDGNVVVVHCQTGTSVSGLFVASYLLHSRICWTSEQAIKQFRQKRENGIISLPCQTRYLKYIESSVIAGERPEDIQLLLSSITLSNSPAFNEDGSCKPYFVIFQNGEEIFERESTESYKTEDPISFPVSAQISGDIKIQFFSVSDILGTQEMFSIHFHTFYIASSHVRFSREMIDGAHMGSGDAMWIVVNSGYLLSPCDRALSASGALQLSSQLVKKSFLSQFQRSAVCHGGIPALRSECDTQQEPTETSRPKQVELVI
eukprot:sb/3462697/